MNTVSPERAAHGVQFLTDMAVSREDELNRFGTSAVELGDDEEEDCAAPILRSYYESGGNEAIMKMTNFNLREFNSIFSRFEDHIKSNWNVGRGKKSQFKAKDVLLMLLTVMKNGGCWHSMGNLFNVKGPTFEHLITRFITVLSEKFYDDLVVDLTSSYTMERLVRDGKTFSHFKHCLYATDVAFQQTNRPSGSVQEGKPFFSEKHKLYGIKVEVCVLPVGLAVSCSNHVGGCVSDMTIMQNNVEDHKRRLVKKSSEDSIEDVGDLRDKYPNSWAVICDKGYQEASQHLRVLSPFKKSTGRPLSPSQTAINLNISSDRVIVDYFLGRMCRLWSILSNKFRWQHKSYDSIFKICLALTNLHVFWHPLREQDGHLFNQLQNRLNHIAHTIARRRKQTQRKYLEKRRMRLASQIRDEDDDDMGSIDTAIP